MGFTLTTSATKKIQSAHTVEGATKNTYVNPLTQDPFVQIAGAHTGQPRIIALPAESSSRRILLETLKRPTLPVLSQCLKKKKPLCRPRPQSPISGSCPEIIPNKVTQFLPNSLKDKQEHRCPLITTVLS